MKKEILEKLEKQGKKVIKTETLVMSEDGEVLSEKVTFKRPNGSVGVTTINLQADMAQQHYKSEQNINNILEKWHKNRILGPTAVSKRKPLQDVDFTQIPASFQDAMELVVKSEEAFNALPSKVRNHFGNSPQALLEFVHDAKNRDEAIKLGLIPKPVEPKPDFGDVIKAIKETKQGS